MPYRSALAAFAALAVLMHPLFLVFYRLSAFGTVPRDDYAGFLLLLLGRPGGAFPDSPYCYRVGSMLLAAPFFFLPALPLTNTPAHLPAEYLRATAALAVLAYLSTVLCAVLGHALARQAGLGRAEAVATGALLVLLVLYTQFTAVDPTAVALVAGGALLLRRPAAFGALLLLSVPVNEKVALVLATWLLIRCALSAADRRAFLLPALLAAGCVGLYAGLVAVLRFPGNGYQQEPGSFPATLAANLAAYGSARGLLLNVLPLLVLGGLALLGRPAGVFRRTDALLVPALAVVALVLTQFFQAGRIAMHAAPILVVPAAAGALARLRRAAPAAAG